MSHHLLYTAQVCPILYQMRSKGMTQGMRGNICLDPGSGRILLNQLPETLAAHGMPGTVYKQELTLLPVQKYTPAAKQIMLQRLLRIVAKRDHPLPSLVLTDNVIHHQIQIILLQGDQLGHPHPGRIQKLKHRTVTDLLRRISGRLL